MSCLFKSAVDFNVFNIIYITADCAKREPEKLVLIRKIK